MLALINTVILFIIYKQSKHYTLLASITTP